MVHPPPTCSKPSNTAPPKRQRLPNFTAAEVRELVNLISEHRDIIESRSISRDVKDTSRRSQCWRQILETFHGRCSGSREKGRTLDGLRKKWDNLKTEAKQQASKRKKCLLRTGGGEVMTNSLLEVVEDIMEGVVSPVKRVVSPAESPCDSGNRHIYIPMTLPVEKEEEVEEEVIVVGPEVVFRVPAILDHHGDQTLEHPDTPSTPQEPADKRRLSPQTPCGSENRRQQQQEQIHALKVQQLRATLELIEQQKAEASARHQIFLRLSSGLAERHGLSLLGSLCEAAELENCTSSLNGHKNTNNS